MEPLANDLEGSKVLYLFYSSQILSATEAVTSPKHSIVNEEVSCYSF